MMSPTSEVKPSQVAQLTAENEKLKEEIDELKEEAEENKKLFDTTFSEFMKLQAHNEKLQNDFQKGYDEGREEYQVDKEYLDEKEEEIDKLKAENEAMIKTLPNDMDGYGFDRVKMRWVHYDEDEEEEEEEEDVEVEDCFMLMVEGKKYYVDPSDCDVQDAISGDVVGSWNGETIIFN